MLKQGLLFGVFSLILIMTFYCTWVGAGKEEDEEVSKIKAGRAVKRQRR